MLLYKKVICPVCRGNGFISKSTETSISSENCVNCAGTGLVMAPMTNGDIIRRCTDEQLGLVFKNLKEYARYSGGANNRLLDGTVEDDILWLNKEADNVDLSTIFSFFTEDVLSNFSDEVFSDYESC